MSYVHRAKLDQLEEKNAEVEEYKRCLERLQRDYEERLQGTATELRRLQLEKTMLQVRNRHAVVCWGLLFARFHTGKPCGAIWACIY